MTKTVAYSLEAAREHRAKCYRRWLRGDAYTSELEAWDRGVFALDAKARAPMPVTLTVLGDPDGYGAHLFLVEWEDTPELAMPARLERATGRVIRANVADTVTSLERMGHTVTVIRTMRLD